jgi:hypothetical protein
MMNKHFLEKENFLDDWSILEDESQEGESQEGVSQEGDSKHYIRHAYTLCTSDDVLDILAPWFYTEKVDPDHF